MEMMVTSQERTWAALAHASTLLTLLVGLASAGVGGVFFIFVPLVIYLSYKNHSRFVAYHAAQAFAFQLVGTLGYLLVVLVGVVLLVLIWLVTGILSMVLIGLILVPFALLLTLAFVALALVMPLVFCGYAVVATVETANGLDYRYPRIGDYVENWLSRRIEAVRAV